MAEAAGQAHVLEYLPAGWSASLAAACLHCEMIHDNLSDSRIPSCKKKSCELVWANELVVFLLKIQWIQLLQQLSGEWIYSY